MRNIFILFSFVLVGLGLSIPGTQDEIITKNGDVSQECNVETIDKYLLYNTENKTDGADDEPNSLLWLWEWRRFLCLMTAICG